VPLRRVTNSPRFQGARSTPRRRVWIQTGSTVTGAGPFGIDALQDFRTKMGITAGPVGLTVVRSVGWINCTAGTTIYTGLLVGSSTLDIADADPSVDFYEDWMFHDKISGVINEDRSGGSAFHRFDIRSKRRLDELGETLWWRMGVTAGGVGATFSLNARHLLMLP